MRYLMLIGLLLTVFNAQAHRFAPSLLQIQQISDDSFAVTWKTPIQTASDVPLVPMLPASCIDQEVSPFIQEGTGKLQQAHRTMLETEAIGESILGDLRSQRETLTHATGTLQRANEGLARSKRTLDAIARRALNNKLLMYVLIVMLTLAVLFLGYFEMFGFGKGGGGGDKADAAVLAASPPPPS